MTFWRTTRAEPDTSVLPNGDGCLLTESPVDAGKTVHPEDASTASESALSPARSALAAAISMHRAAIAALEEAQTPLRRLQGPIDELAHVERRLSEIDRETDAAIGAWIARGGCGERPAGPPEVVGLRQKRDALLADVTAAQLAMPPVEAGCQQAAQAAVASARQLDLALIGAVVEVARDMVEIELVPAVANVLRVEARIQGLRHALQAMADRGHDPLPAASAAACQIAELISEGRRRPGVQIDVGQARRFIDAMATNAQAVF